MCTCRLSKELQQKDKIIESLHTKLQHRPETPSSCQALSETTDHSDRTSLVSDRTNEDLELSSDLDAREYQDEHGLAQPGCRSDQDGKDEGLILASMFVCLFVSFILSFIKYLFSVDLPHLSFSLSIHPSSSWPPQVLLQLSQHALLSLCGFDQSVLQRYGTHRRL